MGWKVDVINDGGQYRVPEVWKVIDLLMGDWKKLIGICGDDEERVYVV